MNLDQVLHTAPDTPRAFQSAQQRSAELYADILAVAPHGDGRVDIEAVQCRPSILRRTAALLAEVLPHGTDRLVCTTPQGLATTTALALHTGLPFATVTGTGDDARLTGEAHPGEHTVVVVPLTGTAQDAAPPVHAALKAGMRVSCVLSVLDLGDSSVVDTLLERYGVRFHALFPATPSPAPPRSATDTKEEGPR
ncbi:hypothetical protein ACXZ65_35175 [Streptomyces aculeolatus]|jgi:orotate phosphoribosyltransferase